MRLKDTPEDRLVANEILGSDEIWPTVHEDGCSYRDRFHSADQYLKSEICYVLLPSPGCLFIGHPMTSQTLFVHVAIEKKMRGRRGIKATKHALKWIFKNSDHEKLVATIPAFNKAAICLAGMVGFKHEGRITKAFKKDGTMHDMVVFGLTKEELQCPQP